ncbi:MAG: tRNA (adenosine(37)-N6)-threonylcarbamoyltransferase complex transferase subunit TsaD [bacterium]|nr:tRNA (adenosine(37)-N6)-threonylcarbamoyltransferase complex transferase subunit TsaD [bacterium]
MMILAIETSCDDTCIAIVEIRGRKRPRFKILTNVVSSQTEVHKKYGGVYPTLAVREHKKNLPLVLLKVLEKTKNSKINLIAVTKGPGLDPCLWAGINFAKELAGNWDLPIVPVNHIESHILVNFIDEVKNYFPAIALVVSGGHTQLILVKDPPAGKGKYKIIGETRDDAAGECFDKVARILGLGYPGGPIIAAEAAKIPNFKSQIKLPRPMISQKNYDFSFSGLKTAVLYNYKKQKPKIRKSKHYIQEMSKEIQQAVIDVLIKKTIRAAKEYNVKTIILGGGVSANEELRKQFKSQWKGNLLIPEKKFSTDNAVMTAITGYYNYLQGKIRKPEKIKADANLRIC